MLGEFLEKVRQTGPLVHNITNYVTVNDCANVLLACGASPIMAEDMGEVEEITAICSSLNINIGTLTAATIPAMLAAGKKANQLRHPAVLDPVGAGASKLRTKTALQLLKELDFTVVRGNASEIKSLANAYLENGSMEGIAGGTKGVDANAADSPTEENLDSVVAFSKRFAGASGAVIVITGAIDIVADSRKAFCIRNGHPMMSKITGTGCMLSAMIAAFLAANPHCPLEAAAAAVCVMGLCGEQAFARLAAREGNAAYRNHIIDEIYRLRAEELNAGAKYEIR